MSRENQSGALGTPLLTLSPFFTVFPALLLLLGAISDRAKSWCLGGADVLSLLQGARKWCFLVIGAEIAGIVVILAGTALAANALRKRQASGVWKNFLKMAAIPLVVVCLFGGLMIKDEVVSLYPTAQADIQQIKAGALEEWTVFFVPGSSATHLPGAFDTEKNLIRHQVCTTDGEWLTVYLPEALGFQPEVAYQTSQDMAWNEENASRYRIARTSGFGLVPDAPEPVA